LADVGRSELLESFVVGSVSDDDMFPVSQGLHDEKGDVISPIQTPEHQPTQPDNLRDDVQILESLQYAREAIRVSYHIFGILECPGFNHCANRIMACPGCNGGRTEPLQPFPPEPKISNIAERKKVYDLWAKAANNMTAHSRRGPKPLTPSQTT